MAFKGVSAKTPLGRTRRESPASFDGEVEYDTHGGYPPGAPGAPRGTYDDKAEAARPKPGGSGTQKVPFKVGKGNPY